jgi:PAS domain S-box-containing protein
MKAETKQAQLLKALEERNAYIENILHNLPIGIAVTKIDDGKATIVNKRFSEIYGWPDNVVTDFLVFFENLFPDEAYRNELMDKVLRDKQSGDPERLEWNNVLITTRSGEKRAVNAKNIQLWDQNLVISTVMDVTNEYKQAEELRRTKANQDALINCTQDIIWSVDTEMRLITANRSFLEMVESVTGEMLEEGGCVLLKEFGEVRLSKWKRNYERALKGEHFTINDQLHDPIKQMTRYSAISLSPMINADGSIFGVACFSKDITQNIMNIRELKQNELRISHQNEQLTKIAEINAHEIRRPVASILGLTSLLKETGDLESSKEIMQHLGTATEELDAIIRRIVDKTSP